MGERRRKRIDGPRMGHGFGGKTWTIGTLGHRFVARTSGDGCSESKLVMRTRLDAKRRFAAAAGDDEDDGSLTSDAEPQFWRGCCVFLPTVWDEMWRCPGGRDVAQ